MTEDKAGMTAEMIDELERAARRAEGRCGVLISKTAIGLMQAAPNDRVPRRQIWTTWGKRVAMRDGWPADV